MRKNVLLSIQQYLNNVGFLMLLISATFGISLTCGDVFFPSQLPVLLPSKTNKLVDVVENVREQVIRMDYDRTRDSLCVQVNDYCLSFDDLALVISYEGTPFHIYRRDVIDLRIHKDTPFKYVEQLFNKLRPLDRRLILFRTNTIDAAGETTGVKFLLPPADPVYFASIENQEKEMQYLLPPSVNPKTYYWSLLFDRTKGSRFHVGISEMGILFYNKQYDLSQDVLFIRLKKDLLNLKIQEVDPCIWLDIDQEVSVQHFLETYVTLRNVYEQIWDEFSLQQHGKKHKELESKEDQRLIMYSFPFNLIWMSKKEYQFLKGLEAKNQLNAFIAEHTEK